MGVSGINISSPSVVVANKEAEYSNKLFSLVSKLERCNKAYQN